MRIIIVKDYEDMSQKAAEIFNHEIAKNPRMVLGLATGGTPERFYELLVQAYHKKQTDWANITTFNLDEYIGISRSHKLSYYTYMKERLFSKVNISKNNTFLPNPQGDIAKNGEEYDLAIQSHGGIDLQLLGIGENGHIAFNEPGSKVDDNTRQVDLTKSTIQANSRYFKSVKEVPTTCITMGIGSILRAKRIILIASGQKKAEAIKNTISGPISEKVPSSFLRTHKNVTIIADQEAASLIEKIPTN